MNFWLAGWLAKLLEQRCSRLKRDDEMIRLVFLKIKQIR